MTFFSRDSLRNHDVLSYACMGLMLMFGLVASVYFRSVNAAPGETGLAAIGFLQTGSFSNPYLLPTGPTAHVSPLPTGLVAAIYAMASGNSPLARAVLSIVCLAAYGLNTVMVLAFCRSQGLGPTARAVALVATCLVPAQLLPSIIEYRQWDQPFAALILTAGLLVCSAPARPHGVFRRPDIAMALLAGAAFLTSPSIVPAMMVGLILVIWQTRGGSHWLSMMIRCGLIMTVMVVPWGLRNQADLGKFILTRSNFGLELAVGNNDLATGYSPLDTTIHPHDSQAAAERVATIGEVAYMGEMSAKAIAWIKTNPYEFTRLTLIRTRLLLLPPLAFGGWLPVVGTLAGGLLLMTLTTLKWIGIGRALLRRDRIVLWLAFCLLPIAPYAITHVSARYLYPVFFTSLCLCCSVVDGLARLRPNRITRKNTLPAR